MVTVRDGLDRKDVRKLKPGWVKAAIERCFTEDEIRRLVKSLEPKEQLDLLVRVQPREIKADSEGLIVRIMLEGIVNKVLPIQGQVVKGELTGHDPE